MPHKIGSTPALAWLALLAAVLAVAASAGFALERLWHVPPGTLSGREAVRFPRAAQEVPAVLGAPMVCGISARRLDGLGTLDLMVQAGAVIRMDDGTFDSHPGAADAMVPEWARDHMVPWGWNGPWQMGLRSTRHLHASGWPWLALATIYEPQFLVDGEPRMWVGLDSDGYHRVTATSPPGGGFPTPWPTLVSWPAMVANALVQWIPMFALVVLGALGVRACVSRYRRSRGFCPKCRYPLAQGGQNRCPECGETSNSERRPKGTAILP